MPISRARKEDLVAQYISLLQDSAGIVVTEYRGLSVAQFNNIRKRMRDVGAKYIVTKNTLLKIALNEVGMAVPEELLNGPVAVGFASDNLPGTVKALIDSVKDAELLILKGAIAQSTIYGPSDLETLSKLPTLDELRATLVGMVVQPMASLLSLLVAPQRDVVSVIASYVREKGGGDEAA
ncbi:MAG: 50S ribosomal protein L10 [Phototrophicales bacterium]|nr:MAG: 50S ribosomal protein L10 [Phototrophicales bacterium]